MPRLILLVRGLVCTKCCFTWIPSQVDELEVNKPSVLLARLLASVASACLSPWLGKHRPSVRSRPQRASACRLSLSPSPATEGRSLVVTPEFTCLNPTVMNCAKTAVRRDPRTSACMRTGRGARANKSRTEIGAGTPARAQVRADNCRSGRSVPFVYFLIEESAAVLWPPAPSLSNQRVAFCRTPVPIWWQNKSSDSSSFD